MLRQILPSLYLLQPAEVAGPTRFTYILKRASGNLLFGTKADVLAFVPDIKKLGPTHCVLLGDRHHATAKTVALGRHLGAPLCCSDIEAKALKSKGVSVDTKLPYRRDLIVPELEAIPTPGHTPGALSYLWTSQNRKTLFIGDTLVPVRGEWRYWVTKKNRSRMRGTIELLAGLDFDVIVSNSFAATPQPWIAVDKAYRRVMFDKLKSGLSADS